jgi:hypothetical protein
MLNRSTRYLLAAIQAIIGWEWIISGSNKVLSLAPFPRTYFHTQERKHMVSNDNNSSTLLDKTPETPEMLSEGTRAYLERLNSSAENNGKPPITKRPVSRHSWWNAPIVVLFLATILMVGMVSFGFGASSINASNNASASNAQSGSNTGTDATPTNVPTSQYQYGGLPAKYVIDPDGAKHFTFTAEQVMWSPVKGGQPVLA